MTKPPTLFKRATNTLLRHLEGHGVPGEVLPSEKQMAELMQCSRTAVRSAIAHLCRQGLILDLKERRLLRHPGPDDYFDESETQSGTHRVQEVLMERIHRSDLRPGDDFSESELARAAGASTVSVREFLIGFARFGLIEKKPRGGWRLCAFDEKFAAELEEVRRIFELNAVSAFVRLPPEHDALRRLDNLIKRHEAIADGLPGSHLEFPSLDREFHSLLIAQLDNRFAQHLNDLVSLVFHYHYQWDKRDEMPRISHAVHEHLAILRALARRDGDAARAAMSLHLDSARRTLQDAALPRSARRR